MDSNLALQVEALLAELDDIPNLALDESQTRRSEILQEILQVVSVSMSQRNTPHGA